MGADYLADSNAIIDLVLGRLPVVAATWLDTALSLGQVELSVITQIELLTKTEPVEEYTTMQLLVQSLNVLSLDEPVVRETIRLRQQHRIKLPDAIIAATALTHGLTLVTRNVADFTALAGLALLNPHEAGQLPAA